MDSEQRSEIGHNERFFLKQLEVFNKTKYGYTTKYKLYRIFIPFAAIIMSLYYYVKVNRQSNVIMKTIETKPQFLSLCLKLNMISHKFCRVTVLSGLIDVTVEMSTAVKDPNVLSTMVTEYVSKMYDKAQLTILATDLGDNVCIDVAATYEEHIQAIRIEPVDMYEYVSNYSLIALNVIMSSIYTLLTLLILSIIF